MTRTLTFVLLSSLAALPAARAQQLAPTAESLPTVESVAVAGNQFLEPGTLLFYVSTKPGERYDERRLKDDFRRLWDTGFLEDLALRVTDGPQGRKVVVFQVLERKRIQIVDFRGNKAVSNTDIEDELKKREAALKVDTFYDPAKARKVEAIIKEMLAAKGHPFATVKHEPKTIGGAGQQVSFVIDEGAKTKVATVEFTGNEVFSDGKLRKRMKQIKPKGFWNLSWLSGKTTYTPDKWNDPHEGDRARVEELYLNNGYVTAQIGEPKITYTDVQGKKPKKLMHIEIPVTEGEQYRVGDLKFEGLTVFKEEGIRPMFKVRPGDVYNDSKIRKGYDKLRDLYGALGYFQWTGLTKRTPDAEKKVVDVVLTMEEDKRYYLGKIKFVGNDTTRDKVIRREVYMNEGDVFNTEALKMSIKRINQLGYFKPMEGAPELSASPDADDKLDVTFKVEEQNRNQFTFGGGVSGLEGTFINASFSTANFLGMGETFQVSAQSGRRTKNYQIAVTEPYLFDRPITAGFDVYKRRLRYEPFGNVAGYTLDTTGAGLVGGFPVGRFTRLFMNYAYEIIQVEDIVTPGLLPDPVVDPDPDPAVPTPPVFDPFFLGETGKRRESRFTPSLVHNTVDNPWQPTSGTKHTLTLALTGGPLGGTVNFFRPDIETIFYIKHTRRTSLGLRGQFALLKPFGDTEALPVYQRFFLGGETQIRGYNVRTVGPIDAENRALGGDKFILFNAEYYVDIFGPLRFLLFYDAGQAYAKGEPIKLNKLRTSTGAELRFIMPVLNVPFRLIYAWNPQRDAFQPKSTFKFAVGTTF